ncbi:MAG: MoxR family ATPase [Chloroflexi bacterium]|nr:MAG: MoxR family ATPase [Chloroflexota bacterium]
MAARLDVVEFQRQADRIINEVSRALVGKHDALRLALVAMAADGHILIEDLPGLGKTLMARSFASALGLDFKRVQFTPDLMPADITGTSIYNQASGGFEFLSGPVFTNLLLADEINRAPAKTQAALLEAMQERQVTVDGETRPLDVPFLVIATQNPLEFEGTYPLPEAQLDRFLSRLAIGYPDPNDEAQILQRRVERREDEVVINQVMDKVGFRQMQKALEGIHVSRAVMRYIVALVGATRGNAQLQVGASPRGALALMKLARGWAALDGRDFVLPDDVKTLAVPALAHRVSLKPELWIQDQGTQQAILETIASVPTPSASELAREA